MTKIVINTGSGFDLTHAAVMRYAELKGIKLTAYIFEPGVPYRDPGKFVKCEDPGKHICVWESGRFEDRFDYFINRTDEIIPCENKPENYFSKYCDIERTDPALIQVVEELKDSEHLDLKIVEIPDDVKWEIHESEMGPECVREVSRCWK